METRAVAIKTDLFVVRGIVAGVQDGDAHLAVLVNYNQD